MQFRGLTHCRTCMEPFTNGFECACTRKQKQEREEKLSMLLDLSKEEITAWVDLARMEAKRSEQRQIKLKIEELNKETKCKYCEEGFCISDTNRRDLGIELHSDTGYLVAYGVNKYDWDISVECKINYCPMCGKKFKEDE